MTNDIPSVVCCLLQSQDLHSHKLQQIHMVFVGTKEIMKLTGYVKRRKEDSFTSESTSYFLFLSFVWL